MRRWPSSSTTPPDPTVAPRAAHLPEGAGAALLALARAAIARRLGVRDAEASVSERPVDTSADWLQREGACFVTLTRFGQLRGCIGSVEPDRPLGADVVDNARAAAFRDRRFLPVTLDELDDIDIEVSVLSPLTPMPVADEADAIAQLRPGVDGVVLELGDRRATFLPQVWDKVPDPAAFLAHLKTKAGLPATYWSEQIRLSRYTVAEFHEEH